MTEHTGFHEYKEGKRFNPECLECQWKELARIRDEKLLELSSIFTQIQILSSLTPRLI